MKKSWAWKHKGAHSELIACAWLLKEGYEVFRNISQHGLIDVIAEKDGVFLKLDVKTDNGSQFANWLTDEQVAAGVLPLIVSSDGKCRIGTARPPQRDERCCSRCSKPFIPTHRNSIYCSIPCKRGEAFA